MGKLDGMQREVEKPLEAFVLILPGVTVISADYYFASVFGTHSLSQVTAMLSSECSCTRPSSACLVGGHDFTM